MEKFIQQAAGVVNKININDMKYTEQFKNKIVEEYINTPNNLKSIKNLANKYND